MMQQPMQQPIAFVHDPQTMAPIYLYTTQELMQWVQYYVQSGNLNAARHLGWQG
jgi:hypothetical protein